MQILLLLSTIALIPILWTCTRLAKNYITARKIGLPILITPVGQPNFLFLLSREYLTPILKALPFGLGNWVNHTGFHWYFADRYRSHVRLGPAFSIVTPTEVQVVLADAELVEDVLSRRKDFDKDPNLSLALEIFGRNLVASSNDNWARQRRLTTPPFNERNSSLVWREALRQSSAMIDVWDSKGSRGVPGTPNDTMTLALHVLIAAGLGKTYDFVESTTNLTGSHKISYRDAIKTIIANMILAVMIKLTPLPLWIVSSKVREVSKAVAEFGIYMKEMLQEEKNKLGNVDVEKNTLMTALLRASNSREGNGRNGLSDEEITGNLFIFNVAGHDTTAGTISYSLYLLSVYLEVQDWVSEEIQAVFGGQGDPKSWDYEKSFPRLKRCLALMNETLRLYPPVVANSRNTMCSSQTITVQGKNHNLPPHTNVMLNMVALSTLPQYWGSDSLLWRPDRWVTNSASGSLDEETMWQNDHSAFIPFSSGPRSCPGRKFAQVEFVAVIARLFHKHRCEPVLLKGETMLAAKKRVLEVVEDSNLVLTLKMRHSERVKLRWEEVV